VIFQELEFERNYQMKVPDNASVSVGLNGAEESQTNMSPRKKLGSASDLIDEPAYELDNGSFTARRVQTQRGVLGALPIPLDAMDKKATVKWIWKVLTDPDRPCDSTSVDYRVELIRYLENLMRTEFASTKDLRQHVERYLDGHDGRRMPISQAIRRARKKLKLTQRQLAELLGFRDHTLLSQYENGERVPSGKVIKWLKEGGM
jgi:DNA-binding transcriptional regulator YiaG